MRPTQSDINLVKMIATDNMITLTDKEAKKHAQRILNNMETTRKDPNFSAKYYEQTKEYFIQ